MKILIYFNKSEIRDSGGPNGYLYNLLNTYKGNEIELLDFPVYNGKIKKIYTKLPNFFKQIYRLIHNIKFFKTLKKGAHVENIDFTKYDIIHFHECFSLYKERKFLENYHGKIVLTNHTPSSPISEIMDTFITNFEKRFLYKSRYKFVNTLVEFSYKRADFICYPTKFSDESYFTDWENYKNIIRDKKIIYLLTGIVEKKFNLKKENLRKKYGIKDGDFVINYVGRHLEVKGYDVVKKVFTAYKNDNHMYFLIGGKEYPLKGYKSEKRWIEIGWTNDAGSLINASDVFLLPNKETYFDIVMLEVLSLGTPILCSYTGGNKYFEGKSEGILLYKDFDELIDKINYLNSLDSETLLRMGNENKNLYLSDFTSEKFLDNYLKLMRSILDEN